LYRYVHHYITVQDERQFEKLI